jgi:vacuolar-type H+-ATPase subunit E/Vma4
MPLPDILRAIEEGGDEEVARIEAEAEREVEAILARARAEAERVAQEVRQPLGAELRVATERLRGRARAEAARLLRESREEVYRRVLDLVVARLASIRERPGYRASLRALVDEALGALPDAAVVHVDPRDAEAVGNDRLPPGVRVAPDLQTWGGVEAAAEDGRVIRNTLEERLRRADPFVRPLIAKALPGTPPGPADRAKEDARA